MFRAYALVNYEEYKYYICINLDIEYKSAKIVRIFITLLNSGMCNFCYFQTFIQKIIIILDWMLRSKLISYNFGYFFIIDMHMLGPILPII